MKPMKAIKPRTDATQGIPCFECEAGTLLPTVCDHRVELAEGKVLAVPEVPMLVCDQCGDRVTGDEGNARINAFLDENLNRSGLTGGRHRLRTGRTPTPDDGGEDRVAS